MLKQVLVPDIGAFSNVEIIEVLVAVGESVALDASLITLETDKATLEVPAPFAGVVKQLEVKVGDKVSEGSLILTLEVEGTAEEGVDEKKTLDNTPSVEASVSLEKPSSSQADKKADSNAVSEKAPIPLPEKSPIVRTLDTTPSREIHAGPKARRFARELGVDLGRVQGTGRKGRIVIADIQGYVKQEMAKIQSGGTPGGLELSISPWPQVDYAKFGSVTVEPLPRIKKLSGSYLHRNWVMVPHVTQFDEADITELEKFRKQQHTLAEQEGVKLTPLVFIMKAAVVALKQFPTFNASLDSTGSQLTLKHYFHIGVAVDTPNGLVVPVVRDVDQKGLFQLAKELGEISQKARQGALSAQDMQGSSFSISSLGGIGGTAFTPIINVPDVAILGVSKAQIKPIFMQEEFKPRLMLPLSLSYDHRVIDGAEAVRFTSFFIKQLSDIRLLLL